MCVNLINTYMPRLTLYKPTKTNDYNFMDRVIREQFDIGGTGVNVHKYIGPAVTDTVDDLAQPNYIDGREVDPFTGDFINVEGIINETKIQDLLFLENRDRKYDTNIYDLRGVYNVQDNDFDLTQFEMFLANDQFYMTFHMNEMVKLLGRKLLAGDVLELPHLREFFSLSVNKDPINKYYVITDANRGAEGFSQTWYPHIWRVKLSPITDAQEYSDIVGDSQLSQSIAYNQSSYNTEFNITDLINGAAKEQDPTGQADTSHLFGYDFPTSGGIVNNNSCQPYVHGEPIAQGSTFPSSPQEGQFFLRTDFQPNRLFVRRGSKWVKSDANVCTDGKSLKSQNASDFIWNDNITVVDNEEFTEKQPLSEVIRPRPDTQIDTGVYVESGYVDDGYIDP